MTKFLSSILTEDSGGRVGFHCPGCQESHFITVASQHNPGNAWGYNGNPAAPTFTPSILVRSGHYVPGHDGGTCWCNSKDSDGEDWGFGCGICHSFVTNGHIQFLSDCTHHLVGKTVPLPAWPERLSA